MINQLPPSVLLLCLQTVNIYCRGGCAHTDGQFAGHFSKHVCIPDIVALYIKFKQIVFIIYAISIFFYCIYFIVAVKRQLFCPAIPPPAAVSLVRSIMWSGTVPLTSVYGESVSTPAVLRASISFVIRRVNQDAGESVKSWALGHGSVTTGKWMLFKRRLYLAFAVDAQQLSPHERGSTV